MKAYELLESEKNFTRANFAVNSDGVYTNPGINPETGTCVAVQWDLQGALFHCYPYEMYKELHDKAMNKLIEINKGLDRNKKPFANLADLNDRIGHTGVIAFLKEIEN